MDEGARDRNPGMTVRIWSDVVCPFCYIGKRRFERALESFERRDAVRVEWKSFQLNPQAGPMPGRSIEEYLAVRKGWSPEHSRRMHDHVARMAAEAGLEYRFDKVVVAGTRDAHRLIQLAKSKGETAADRMEETLFRAYFTEGRDIGDRGALAALAGAAGLDPEEARAALDGGAFAAEAERDFLEARQAGVTGVPFYVFDGRYAVSGAQDPAVFLSVLRQAWDAGRGGRPA
jgi:predicted DsbA family dithiol-disulfide isomerase